MSQQHRALWIFFPLSLFPDELSLFLPKPPHVNVQYIAGKGYLYKPELYCKRHLRASNLDSFSAYFLFDSFKGPLKHCQRVDSYFYHSTLQHFRHIYIPESIIIHNILAFNLWLLPHLVKNLSEAINQLLHVKLPFILWPPPYFMVCECKMGEAA